MKLLRWAVALAIAVCGAAFGAELRAAQAQNSGNASTNTITVDGLERTYTVTVPTSYDGSAPVPMVIALHTFASSGKAMQALTGLDQWAEEDGFIAVYPDALDLGWTHNIDSLDTGNPSGLRHADDSAFLTALIDRMESDYSISETHLTAFGSGGWMAYALACDIPDRLESVAVVGIAPLNFQVESCGPPAAPVSMLMLFGAEDDMRFPVTATRKATTVTEPIRRLEPGEAVEFWAARNGCDPDAAITGGELDYTVYESCDGGVSVAQYMLAGVGHNWLRDGDYILNQYNYDMTDLVTRYFFGDEAWADLLTAPDPSWKIYFGLPRSYAVYVPPTYDPAAPTPLVIALHGRPHNGVGFAYLFDFNRVAQENNFIVVYPDGFQEEWNYVRDITPGYEDWGVDDVEFLNFLIDDLAHDLNIDRARLYVTGFSNGGFMTQRLACEPENPFAAFAVIGATLFPPYVELCADTPVKPILLMHGTMDRSVPWIGITYNGTLLYESVPDTVTFWAAHNRCDPQQIDYRVLPETDPTAPTTVFRYEFTDCANHANTLYYVIENGGHNLPGVPNRLAPDIAGEVNEDIHAGTEIWAFFRRYTWE